MQDHSQEPKEDVAIWTGALLIVAIPIALILIGMALAKVFMS